MRKAFALLAAAMAFCLAQSSFAQNNGWYVGGTIGQSKVKDFCTDCVAGESCDDTDTAWRFLAGYQFNRYFAAELGYHDLGQAKDSAPSIGSADFKANAIELVAVGSWPFTSQFSVYGKGGMYRGETKANFNFTPVGLGTGNIKETNTDLTYGVGLRFDLNRNIALRGEWQRYTNLGDNATIGESDVDVLSLGVLWKF